MRVRMCALAPRTLTSNVARPVPSSAARPLSTNSSAVARSPAQVAVQAAFSQQLWPRSGRPARCAASRRGDLRFVAVLEPAAADEGECPHMRRPVQDQVTDRAAVEHIRHAGEQSIRRGRLPGHRLAPRPGIQCLHAQLHGGRAAASRISIAVRALSRTRRGWQSAPQFQAALRAQARARSSGAPVPSASIARAEGRLADLGVATPCLDLGQLDQQVAAGRLQLEGLREELLGLGQGGHGACMRGGADQLGDGEAALTAEPVVPGGLRRVARGVEATRLGEHGRQRHMHLSAARLGQVVVRGLAQERVPKADPAVPANPAGRCPAPPLRSRWAWRRRAHRPRPW